MRKGESEYNRIWALEKHNAIKLDKMLQYQRKWHQVINEINHPGNMTACVNRYVEEMED